MDKNIVLNAETLARAAHEGQMRKGEHEPYINHPKRIVDILVNLLGEDATPEMLAAGWLHDTLEDTELTAKDILEATNPLTLEYVQMLTEDKRYKTAGFSRVECKQRYTIQLLHARPAVQTVKGADILENLSQFPELYGQEESWAIRLVTEKAIMRDSLWKADHRILAVLDKRLAELKQLYNLE